MVRVSSQKSPVGGAAVLRDLEKKFFASTSQQQTTYFNKACCQAKLGDTVKALDDLEKSLSLGFDDFSLLKSEPDFDAIRPDLERLMKKYKPKSLLQSIFGPILKQVDIR